MTKKKKKIDQIEESQEFKGMEDTEIPVESTENSVTDSTESAEYIENQESPKNPVESTENIEESETTMAMVHCKTCKKEVDPYSTEKGWKCPSCNKFVQSPDLGKPGETIREVKPSRDRPYEIVSARNIKFSGSELAQAEMLIQSGVAKDFHDLAKKAFNLIFIKEKLNKAFSGNNTMELNKEPNPERTMKQIQEQEMMKAYIEGMKKGNTTDPMQMMMMMRMMDNQSKGKETKDNGFMDKMLEIQMMKSVMGGQNSETSTLQKEISELKHQTQMQQLMNQQQQTQQGQTSSQQFMQEMEKIRAERDQSIKQADIAAQRERDKNLNLAFDNRRIELESRLKFMEKEMKEKGSANLGAKSILQMKEQIAAVKEMSKALGDKEKGAGEYIAETITDVAGKALPALQTLMEQKQQRSMMQPMMQPMPQGTIVETEPQGMNPMPPPGFEPGSMPSQMPMEQPNEGLTPTEQDISNQMSDMYIKKYRR